MGGFQPEKQSGQAIACFEDAPEEIGARSGGSSSPLLEEEEPGCLTEVVADKKGEGSEGFLVHLNGTRFCLSIWILADHFLPGAGVFVDRANVAVDLFIIMSGFVTQWAYGSRDMLSGRTVAQFYVRRIGRVFLPTYLSMISAAVLMVTVLDKPVSVLHMLGCLCFLEPWREPEDWCPNGQIWTIAALLPSWLLFPVWKSLVATVEARRGAQGLVGAMVVFWVLAFGPSLVVFAAGGGWITQRQHAFLYLWPPSQLADFALGMVTGALARRHVDGGPTARTRGFLADAALAVMVCIVMAAPPSGQHRGWEPLYNHGLALVLASYLYGSTAAGGSGAAASVLSLKPLACMGKYSLEIFLFQQPLYSLYEHLWLFWLRDYGIRRWHVATVYMLTLFSLAALYGEFVEVPYVRWLKSTTLRWAA
uniref:Acyltransferase 3 domain-containing protein n=1 Tax=Alexandrium monilatum TaxID=311494 RepID=A0A7S4Q421_9DINO